MHPGKDTFHVNPESDHFVKIQIPKCVFNIEIDIMIYIYMLLLTVWQVPC